MTSHERARSAIGRAGLALALAACGPSASAIDADETDATAIDTAETDAAEMDATPVDAASIFDVRTDTRDGAPRDAVMDVREPDAHSLPPRLSPMSLDFGTLLLGSSSGPQTVRVTNVGGSPLGPFTTTLTGAHARSFSVPRDTCGRATLAPGLSCEVDVIMSGAPLGDLAASLDVMTATDTTGSVGLVGRVVVGPDSYVDPPTADFGSWSVGERSPSRMFTIRNAGTLSTGIVTVALTGANPADFVIETSMSTCEGTSIPGGGSCVVLVSFAPTMSGSRSASLRFTAAPGGTPVAALSGTAP